MGRIYVCSGCSATAGSTVSDLLPGGWESEQGNPGLVWCGDCIDKMLEEITALLRLLP